MSYGRELPTIGSIGKSNNTRGRPATSVIPDCTATANICRPSGLLKNNSCPSRDQSGRRPPPVEIGLLDFQAPGIARYRCLDSRLDRKRPTRRPSSAHWGNGRCAVADLVLEQHLRIGRAVDRDPPDRLRDCSDDVSVTRRCLPSADQPSARRLRSSLRTCEKSLVGAAAIRQPPEELWIACSHATKR